MRHCYFAFPLLLTLASACSDRTTTEPESTPGADHDAAVEAKAPPDTSQRSDSGPDGASCVVAAAHYDAACTADSDCVAVPVGGNTCDVCSAGTGAWVCPLTAIAAASATAYKASLAAGLASYEGTTTYQQCIQASCPTLRAAVCHQGTCTLEGSFGDDAATTADDASTSASEASTTETDAATTVDDASADGGVGSCAASGGACIDDQDVVDCGDPHAGSCASGYTCCVGGAGTG